MDSTRIAVWGWSGGGSATLNLMFQYPEIYKTGIAIAPVANQLTYDNIYQERYMGLPQENKQDFVNGSPMTYARTCREIYCMYMEPVTTMCISIMRKCFLMN